MFGWDASGLSVCVDLPLDQLDKQLFKSCITRFLSMDLFQLLNKFSNLYATATLGRQKIPRGSEPHLQLRAEHLWGASKQFC